MTTMRTRYFARYYYPGLLFPEDLTRDVQGSSIAEVVAGQKDDRWYGVDVFEITEEVLQSETYGETLVERGRTRVANYLVGTPYHYQSLPAKTLADPSADILQRNIKVNDKSGGYGVLTRCGNWQIRSDWETVISPDDSAFTDPRAVAEPRRVQL